MQIVQIAMNIINLRFDCFSDGGSQDWSGSYGDQAEPNLPEVLLFSYICFVASVLMYLVKFLEFLEN